MAQREFAAALTEARLRKGLSKSELARRLGKSTMAVVNWEKGVTQPRAETKEAVKSILGMEINGGERSGKIADQGSLVEAFKRQVSLLTGHPVERIAVQVTLT